MAYSQCVHLLYCVNKAFCFVNLAGIPKFIYERKNEKDSGRSSINEAIVQMAYCIQNENCLISEKDDYWRSCVPVITVTWLKLKYLLRKKLRGKRKGSVYHLYGNPVILERIQMERLIPFSRFDRNDRNFLYYLP